MGNLENKEKEWQDRIRDTKQIKPNFLTSSGIKVKPIYAEKDLKDFDYLKSLGFPGMPPYTRGIYPTMYRGRPWTIRLFSGHGTPEDTNKRWKMLYDEGETGFSAAVDSLTFCGYDPSDKAFAFEVGTEGVPLYCIDSLRALVKDLPIDKMSVALVVEPQTSCAVSAMYFNVAKENGVDPAQVRGTTQNDILTGSIGFMIHGAVPPSKFLKMACDLIEYCSAMKKFPKWNPINFTTYNYREGGINAVQEIAFGFANAIEHIQELLDRGWKVDDFADRLAFHLSADKDFFEEIAKYRAARRMWYRIMKDRFGAKEPESFRFRYHIQTAGSSLAAQQPMNNIVRIACQALEAILGGCQSLHTNSYDEALCLPSEEAVRIAVRTQQIILEEIRVTNTIDPLAGSYYVEWLTDELEERIWKYLGKIESAGGVVKALESGWLYHEVSREFHKKQKDIEKCEEKVVGVNCYVSKHEEPRVFRTNPAATEIEIKRLENLKKRRDNNKVRRLLDKLHKTCDAEDNVMPVVMELTKEGATLAEITDIYRKIWGTWRAPLIV
jgi:methylmalonyl-CoA mutase N-terminal domain/subunit